jgi:hypothetical protein
MACNWLQNSRQKSFRVYCNQVNDGFAQLAVICAKRSIGNFELIVLKNSCLIEWSIADSIPLLIGGFGDDGTKAGGASGAVL